MYTMLVPAEEQKLYNDAKSNTVKLKYVLSARDYFTYDEEMGPNSFAPQSILTQHSENPYAEDKYTRISLACLCCSGSEPISLKDKQSQSYIVKSGQMEAGEHFQYSKTQFQVVKELVDQGLTSIGTHYCESCNAKRMHNKTSLDIEKLCLPCALDHKQLYGDHQLVLILTPQLIQTLFKKSEVFELLVRESVKQMQLRTLETQVDSFMREIFKLLPKKIKN